jgi:hypothetical protein
MFTFSLSEHTSPSEILNSDSREVEPVLVKCRYRPPLRGRAVKPEAGVEEVVISRSVIGQLGSLSGMQTCLAESPLGPQSLKPESH